MRDWGEALWTARDLWPASELYVESPLARIERERAERRPAAARRPSAVEEPGERPSGVLVLIPRRELWGATAKGFVAGALASAALIVSTFWNAADRPILVEEAEALPSAGAEGASMKGPEIGRSQDLASLRGTVLRSEDTERCQAAPSTTKASPRAPAAASVSTEVDPRWREARSSDGHVDDWGSPCAASSSRQLSQRQESALRPLPAERRRSRPRR